MIIHSNDNEIHVCTLVYIKFHPFCHIRALNTSKR